jgi:hypothetical protein
MIDHRESGLSNRFDPWADAIMRSIQANILEVVRARAERSAHHP